MAMVKRQFRFFLVIPTIIFTVWTFPVPSLYLSLTGLQTFSSHGLWVVLKIRQSTIFLSSANKGDVSKSLTNTDIGLVL